MSKPIRTAVVLILVHLAVTTVHGLAHIMDGVIPGPVDTAFVVLVIYLAPLVAGALLWRKAQVAGAVLLALSMAGALFYGLAGHFLIPGVDNVAQQAAGFWPVVFQITALLLVPLEALGCLWGIRLLTLTAFTRPARQV